MSSVVQIAYPLPQDVIHTVLQALVFNEKGLIPAIAQDVISGDVLMMAWMNRESITMTLTEGVAVYWSRSRGGLWRKGESSGHGQKLVDFRYDCDGDTILMLVHQTGAACHTLRPNCFYQSPRPQGVVILTEPLHSP
jgi:phosphoribosyl-AMP cyclohydrolase